MRFGKWRVRSLCRACSRTTVARELVRCELDLVSVREVRWGKRENGTARGYNFFCGNGNSNYQLGTGFVVHHRILSAVVCDRVSYIVLRGRWCSNVVLHVNAKSEEKINDSKDSFMRNYGRFFKSFS
jgi:hypothetical protein